MTQVNCCLKWLLTIFNIKFAIVGASIIVYTLKSHGNLSVEVFSVEVGPPYLYILGSIVMVIAILGAVGACNESKACMVLFLVCMILGSIVMLVCGTLVAVFRSGAANDHEAMYRSYLPLDKASMDDQQYIERMQTKMQCCGLFSYEDWGGHVPDSCVCSALAETEGKCHAVYDAGVLQQRKSVYIQTCFAHTSSLVVVVLDIVMVIVFSLAALGLLGMILSSIMIHQLRHPSKPVFLMSVPAFTKPPKYQELHNILPAKYY